MRLIDHGFPGSDQLKRQLPSVRVVAHGPGDDPSIKMTPSRDPSLTAAVLDRVPVEATGKDDGENNVTVALHVVEGLLAELEIIGWDAAPRQLRRAEALTVF